MNPSPEPVQLTKTKKALFFAACLLILTVLFVAFAEVLLRSKGHGPWRNSGFYMHVEPGGKYFRSHPTLGYTHIPGRYTVTFATGYSYNVTNLPNTLRITRPIDPNEDAIRKEEIWIFGCSITHGWSLNDEETYPWLLQERFPEYDVVNFGVSGYGTIHSLIQFAEALKTNTPKVAVLAYGRLHDTRNTFSRSHLKATAPMNKLGSLVAPYARLDKEGELQYFVADVEYTEFPMMRYSALSHFVEMKYNELQDNWLRSHAVSEALVKEMARFAEEHEVKFIVANIGGGGSMQEFAEAEGISHTDISVDIRLPENNNLPHDHHPSAFANQKYADRLEEFLRFAFEKWWG